MSPAVQHLIESFDHLPESDQRTAASEILRRSSRFDLPPLSAEELVMAAEEIFLLLDQDEKETT